MPAEGQVAAKIFSAGVGVELVGYLEQHGEKTIARL
jgi:hypothetical protein